MSSNARKGSPPRSSSKGVTTLGSAKARVFVFLTLMILTAVFSASALTANQTAAPETATAQESGFVASSFNNILSFFGLTEAAPTQDGKAARGCDTAPEGLIACYRADNDASDSRGVHNGEWVGTYGYATGKVGAGAFNFSGRGTVEVVDSVELNPSAITVDGWVNLASTEGDFTLISKGDAYSLRVRNGQVVFASRNADGVIESLEGRGTIGAGKWVHIAATNDGAFSRLYIDGEEAGSIVSKGLIKAEGANLVLGSIVSNENVFAASADEVKVFGRALTGKEIAEIAGSVPNAPNNYTIAISVNPVTEGNSTRITVSRTDTNNASTQGMTVTFSANGTSVATLGSCGALNGVDFELAQNFVAFAANDFADKFIDVNTCQDPLVEGTENAVLTATINGLSGETGPTSTNFNITDDDTITNTASAAVNEGTPGAAGQVDFTIGRGAGAANPGPALAVTFQMGGTAPRARFEALPAGEQDYTLSTPTAGCTLTAFDTTTGIGTITFDANATQASCVVRATAVLDDFVERDENISLAVTGPAGIGTPSASSQFLNDDRPWVRVAIAGTGTSATPVAGSQFVEEGTPLAVPGGAFTYTITRGLCQAASSADATPTTSCPGGDVLGLPAQTITFTQAGGAAPAATAGTDFTAVTSLAFLAGAPTNTFTLNPTDDATVEPDESILTTLTGGVVPPGNPFVAGTYFIDTESTATGFINDDDETVSVTAAGSPVAENAGPAGISYTVTRTIDSAGANSLQTPPAGDPDADQIVVAFTLAGAATQASCDGTDYTVSAGAGTVAVNFTPGACPAAGTVTIAGNDPDGIVVVTPVNDSTPENNENVLFTLSAVADPGAAGYGLGAGPLTANGVITNEDFQVTVAVAPSQRLEGSDPPAGDDGGTLVYTFTRIGETVDQICANFNVSGSAEATSDYQLTPPSFGTAGVAPCTNLFTPVGGAGPSLGRIAIAGGAGNPTTVGGVQANQNTFVVTPNDDSVVEGDELVIVQVDNHTAIGPFYSPGNPAQATGQILNDDTEVSVAVSPNAVLENGATNLTYTFSRTGGCGAALTLNTTLSGSATLTNGDFVNPPSLGAVAVTFPAGQCTTQVVIDPVADFVVEADETATFTINPSTGAPNDYTVAAAPGNAATGTITNDDSDVSVGVAGSPANEGNLAPAASAPGSLVYTFTRSGDVSAPLSINYNVGGGTNPATADDFLGAAVGGNTIGFAAGANTTTVTITPVAGNVVENDETVRVTVTAGAGYSPSAVPADGVIRNDDNDIVCANFGATSVAEGTPGAAQTLTFRCTRSTLGAQTNANLSVPYTLGGSATNTVDYTINPASPVVFTGNGNASQTADIVVTTIPDATVEADETVTLNFVSGLAAGGNGYYLNPDPTLLTGTITNDDNDVTLVVSQVNPVGAGKTVSENSGQNLLYTFTRNSQGAALAAQLDVNFSITGTACAATPCTGPSALVDYALIGAQTWNPATGAGSTGSVRFAANVTTVSFTVDPNSDGDVEPNETVIATTTAGPGYVAGATDTGNINNDDTSYTLVFDGLAVRTGTGTVGDPFVYTPTTVEGNPGQPGETVARFLVNRNGVNSPDGTVSVSTIPLSGTAIGGPPNTVCVNNDPATSQDYTADGQTLAFAAGGDAQQLFTVRICRDLFFENTETFDAQLSNPTGGFLGTAGPVTATIVDDDAAPVLRINDPVVNENAGTVTLTVTQSVATNLVTTFNYTTGAVGDTATANVDYSTTTASGTIPAGATSATFTIPIIDDNFDEPDETFTVRITSATNAAITGTVGGVTAKPNGTVTITDNESNTTFSVNNVVQIEGNPSIVDPSVASTSAFNFRITRVGDAQAAETVCFETIDGDIENPAINPNPATGGPNTPAFTFDYTIRAQPALPATNPANCVTFTQGGPSFFTVAVIVYGDDLFEFDEYFTLRLTSLNGTAATDPSVSARFTDRLGLGTIQNDDLVSLFTIAQTTPASNPVAESVGTVTYTVTRTQTAVAATVNYATSSPAAGVNTATGSTAGQTCSTAGVDYLSTSGTLSFAIGQATRTFTVTICNDTFDELNEDYNVVLSSPTFGSLGAPSSVTTTIQDDDAAPIISVSDVSACEVDSGTQAFTFTITRAGNSNLTSTVDVITVSGTAVSPGDFVAIVDPPVGTVNPANRVTFAPGETTKTVTVTVNGDTTFETDESFTLQVIRASADLVTAVGGGADPVGLGSILNVCAGGDPAPAFALGPVTQAEGTLPDGSLNPFFVRLTRTGTTEVPATLTFATANIAGQATGGAACSATVDYISQAGTAVNFPAGGFAPLTTGGVFGGAQGANFVDIPVQVCRDAVFEQNETLNATIAAVQFATISPTGSPALVTITNDDGLNFRIRFPGPEGAEGPAGSTTNFVFTIDRIGDSSVASTVCYETLNGTATAGSDYVALPATTCSTFNAGTMSVNVPVVVNGDGVGEADETFFLRLVSSSAAGSTIDTEQRVATINNDDGPIPPPTGVEGDVVDGAGGAAGDGLVQANDVTAIRNFILSGTTPATTPNQFQRADVNLPCGNGGIDAGDVTVIRNMILGTTPNNTPACGPTAPGGPATIEAGRPDVLRIIRALSPPATTAGSMVTVQFQLDSQGDETSISYTANWNPAILTYVSSAVGNGVPAGTNFNVNATQTAQGRLGVLLDSTNVYAAGTRQIATVTFTVAANAPAGSYPITFSSTPTVQSVSNAQGALLTTSYEQGNVQLVVLAAGVTVSGRVTTANGQGLRNATVVLTDSEGNRRTATTGSFGIYTFEDVEAGQTYVVGVAAKRYRFTTRVLNVTDSLTDVNFVGQE